MSTCWRERLVNRSLVAAAAWRSQGRPTLWIPPCSLERPLGRRVDGDVRASGEACWLICAYICTHMCFP